MAAPPIPIQGSDTLITIIIVPDQIDPENSTSLDTKDRGLGKGQDGPQYSNNYLVPAASDGVDVQRAEQDFAQLNRQLSAYSERSRRLSR